MDSTAILDTAKCAAKVVAIIMRGIVWAMTGTLGAQPFGVEPAQVSLAGLGCTGCAKSQSIGQPALARILASRALAAALVQVPLDTPLA